MKAFIYQIKNNVNGKIYIGQTKDFNRRARNHMSDLKKGTHHNAYLQASFNKYKQENFSITVIEETTSDLVDIKEQQYITSIPAEVS